ncbi:DUF481 domain-containing protein [Flagellimonas zhangzhouensis]|uniref:Salt-induced outer membrane protein YdiY n=1 Tax=Flagellimonas zhangzhouensis TaxID=1073328 RepID=A0A1H2QKI2_9FLAO|nr:DUF481 domain-containing protein [Allomuricauda zhangzhouensis]SDQ54353.1 Protein of unknown function, DUF481 [Allomuricauda zhangzhouensis]SDW07723.1 Protein of unknown function, DUF481 [Allomuricauda zhangzhouensis]
MSTSNLKLSYIAPFILFFQLSNMSAQIDSLVLVNNDMIVGELKELKQGVITIETDYSDSDFKIEWEKIRSIDTQNEFMITVRSGTRYNGILKSVDTSRIAIISTSDTLATVLKNDLVYLKEVQGSFLSNLSASLSVGYNYTKADDLSQLSVRSLLGYRARRWEASANYNDVRSSKNNTNSVKRVDASLGYKYYLKKNWFTLAEVSWLSNTEQNINLRTLGRVGLGKYLVQTNSFYWGLQGGASFNNENFSVDGNDITNNSTEAFLGSELNLYDMGDLSLLTRGILYPSLSESGRWRFDFNFDIKYDLPLDFYINLGVTLNYDNQAVDSASQTDYIFQTMIGWSL